MTSPYEPDHSPGGGSGPRQRARILLSIPPAEVDAFFPPQTREALGALGDVVEVDPASLASLEAFGQATADARIIVTGWGFPRLTQAHLDLAPELAFVVHSASSIHGLVSDDFWASGLPISQSGAAMAPAVAEMSLTFTLSLLRRTQRLDHAMRSGASWADARTISRSREIAGARVGVIGASRTGRSYIAACQALGAEVRIYDPYLDPTDPLAAHAVGLQELLGTSEVVAVHAPETPETIGMLGAREIAAMADGTLFVNTARSTIVDMDALYEAVEAGRIDAALDVFDVEPLPEQDRWRSLPGALLTPHLGGATVESRRRGGQIVVDEIRRHLAGEPLQHSLTRVQLERMG
ncbi:hydroxyacid dehydrogenase [Arthrobacter sp. 35W]|uniref:hydroxyacid dehydrogenase n=1 Tax=Arthrobacter sp. 35W TaxID=1132441 RepID=UPI0004161A9C|nr:hydroxyacid dehydrogenase [Arthrobacter sp. 35W]